MTSAGMITAIATGTAIPTTMSTCMGRKFTPTPILMIMSTAMITSMTKIAGMITARATVTAIPTTMSTRMGRKFTPTPILTIMITAMITSMTKIAGMITAMIMITRTVTPMAMLTPTNMTETAGLPLLVWLSPSFPVGAFAYSHGLEWAVEAGDINNAATCQSWISDLLVHGSGYNDAIIVAATHRAITGRDSAALGEVAELAAAMQPSSERHLEATAQGNAFLTAARAAWEVPSLALLKSAWDGDVAYPVAVGVLSAGHGITLPTTLDAFLLAFSANLVSAAVRLGPIGQTDGQRILAALMPTIRETAKRASDSTLDDLGSAAFRSDLASLRHETQYTRLFRS